jgi:hypothetical protein
VAAAVVLAVPAADRGSAGAALGAVEQLWAGAVEGRVRPAEEPARGVALRRAAAELVRAAAPEEVELAVGAGVVGVVAAAVAADASRGGR